MITTLAEPERSQIAPTGLADGLEKELVTVFKLLSDETRLRILLYLVREEELHVSALCERLCQSQPAVSHHLALLRDAEVIEARREGKHNYYSIRKQHFHLIIAQLFSSITDDSSSDSIRFSDFVVRQEERDSTS